MTSHCPHRQKNAVVLWMTIQIRQNLKCPLCALMTSWAGFIICLQCGTWYITPTSHFWHCTNIAIVQSVLCTSIHFMWASSPLPWQAPSNPFYFCPSLSQLCRTSHHNHCPQLKSTILLIHCWIILPICVSPFMPFLVCVFVVAILASFHLDIAVKQANDTFYSLTNAP